MTDQEPDDRPGHTDTTDEDQTLDRSEQGDSSEHDDHEHDDHQNGHGEAEPAHGHGEGGHDHTTGHGERAHDSRMAIGKDQRGVGGAAESLLSLVQTEQADQRQPAGVAP